MSHPGTASSLSDIKIVDKALIDDKGMIEYVEKILYPERHEAQRFVGVTSKTAYRRIHEVIGTIIDRVTELEKIRDPSSAVNELLLRLASALVLIKWQNARRLVSDNIAETLTRILREVEKELKANNILGAVAKAKRARRIIDSIVVLVYQYGKER